MRTRLPKQKKEFLLVFTWVRYAYFCLSEKKKTRKTFGSQICLISMIPPVYKRVVSSLIIAHTDLFFRTHTQMTTIFFLTHQIFLFFSGLAETICVYMWVNASERQRITRISILMVCVLYTLFSYLWARETNRDFFFFFLVHL